MHCVFLLYLLLFCTFVLADDCGGNCPDGTCKGCPCGTAICLVDISAVCSKFSGWSQTCCECLVAHNSHGNANAVNETEDMQHKVGLFQVPSSYWETCNANAIPCDVEANLRCAVKMWEAGGNSFQLWKELTDPCPCASHNAPVTPSPLTKTAFETPLTHEPSPLGLGGSHPPNFVPHTTAPTTQSALEATHAHAHAHDSATASDNVPTEATKVPLHAALPSHMQATRALDITLSDTDAATNAHSTKPVHDAPPKHATHGFSLANSDLGMLELRVHTKIPHAQRVKLQYKSAITPTHENAPPIESASHLPYSALDEDLVNLNPPNQLEPETLSSHERATRVLPSPPPSSGDAKPDPFAKLITVDMGVKPHGAKPNSNTNNNANNNNNIPNNNLQKSPQNNFAQPSTVKPAYAIGILPPDMRESGFIVDITVEFQHIVQNPHPNHGAIVWERLRYATVTLFHASNPGSTITVGLNAIGEFHGPVRMTFDHNQPLKLHAKIILHNQFVKTLPELSTTVEPVSYLHPFPMAPAELRLRIPLSSGNRQAEQHDELYQSDQRCYSFSMMSFVAVESSRRLNIDYGLDPLALIVIYNFFQERGTSFSPTPISHVNIGSHWGSFSVLAHEWGHYSMYILYIGNWYNVGRAHAFCEREGGQNAQLAWIEGYASAFSVILADLLGLNNQGFYGFDDNSDTPLMKNLEVYTCPGIPNPVMSNDEGRIAAALWDLYDTLTEANNQGNVALGANGYGDINVLNNRVAAVDVLVTPLRAGRQSSITDYWVVLRDHIKGNAYMHNYAIQAMCYNYYFPPNSPDLVNCAQIISSN